VDARIQGQWAGHPRRAVVTATDGDFASKIAGAIGHVSRLVAGRASL
jgi:hypothetical protein